MSKKEFDLLIGSFVLAAVAVILCLANFVVDDLQRRRMNQIDSLCRQPDLMTDASLSTDTNWARLNGRWVVTHYDDSFIGRHHGAYWHGIDTVDFAGDGMMPDTVTDTHHGVAMTSHLYGFPVMVCVSLPMYEGNVRNCQVGTVVDEPRDHIITKGRKPYNHIDLWPGMAKDLGIVDDGIVYGVDVYLGFKCSPVRNLNRSKAIAKVLQKKP